jgi:Holliday junction resolvasome RuvABC endonuclease subunit
VGKPIFVAGIDPGINHIGIAVVDVTIMEVIYAETFTAPNDIGHKLWWEVPILIGIEEPFAGRNFKTYGDTKEMMGKILCSLKSYVGAVPIIRTSPAAGNTVLKLARGVSKTDAKKREAARSLFKTSVDIQDGHQASAIAAAIVAWNLYVKEAVKSD